MLGSLIWGYPVEETVLAAAVVLGIVPSGLFLMIVVTYSMGAVRLANRDALVQGTNAVESLSNVDIFCMDKTGTLTANKMRLADVQPIDGAKEAEVRAMLGDLRPQHVGRDEDERSAGGRQSRREAPDRRRSPLLLRLQVERRQRRYRWASAASTRSGRLSSSVRSLDETDGPLAAAGRLGERRACASSSSRMALNPRHSARRMDCRRCRRG